MKLGASDVSKIYLGTNEVSRVMLGANEVWSGIDSDAQAYFDRITTAGSSISATNKAAVNAFIVGCKADGIWTAIKAACFLAGPDNLTGAIVPLVGTAPTNLNFVSGDHSRTTGLKGNGTNKYLNSNRNNNADPQNSRHAYCRVAEAVTSGASAANLIGSSSSSGYTEVGRLTSTVFRLRSSSAASDVTHTATTGGYGVSRQNGTSMDRLLGSSKTNVAVSSAAPNSINIYFFAGFGAVSICDPRLSFYSIGEYLDLAILDARLTTYMASIA